jgi:hypothetical protein
MQRESIRRGKFSLKTSVFLTKENKTQTTWFFLVRVLCITTRVSQTSAKSRLAAKTHAYNGKHV